MTKILVTGATGQLGGHTVEALRSRVPAADIAALARDPAKLSNLASDGIEVRQGDYFDRDSLERAFVGVDKLLLVAAVTFTDRVTQHKNVIDAAKSAGVGHIFYTGMQRPDNGDFVMPQVTESETETERLLADSGMAVTVLRNGLYVDALPFMVGEQVFERGIRAPAGTAGAAIVSRRDLAEANAVLLSTEGHAGKTYTLTGGKAVTMTELAKIYADISGRPVAYTDLPFEQFLVERTEFPAPVTQFIGEWFTAIAAGEFAEVTSDLAQLLGRSPTSADTVLREIYA